MPTEIYLVKVGMNMTEGVVEEWYIPDGGTVEVGELLYRLETEKVNLDVDPEVAGTVKHLAGEGVTMKPGDVVGYVYAPGEEIPDDLPAAGAATSAPAAEAAEAAAPAAAAPAAVTRGEGERILSSPAARRLAGELGVEVRNLKTKVLMLQIENAQLEQAKILMRLAALRTHQDAMNATKANAMPMSGANR